MMDWGSAYTGFVLASYGLSFLSLAGLAGFVLSRDRRNARDLAQFEETRKP